VQGVRDLTLTLSKSFHVVNFYISEQMTQTRQISYPWCRLFVASEALNLMFHSTSGRGATLWDDLLKQ